MNGQGLDFLMGVGLLCVVPAFLAMAGRHAKGDHRVGHHTSREDNEDL